MMWRATQMIRWVTALATKPDDRSLSPKINMVKGRTDSSYKLPSCSAPCLSVPYALPYSS